MFENKRRIMILVFFVIFLCSVSLASASLFAELLSPFETTNFSDIYDTYYSIIDFIIYTVLFVGLSQVTIGKRFESRGGKAVVIAIGLVLAIGLAISETYIGFNLRSFGPLAAAIFIFLVGLVIFLGIKSAGMEIVGAASITLVITYFSIRSVSPSFFDYMINNQYLSWLHSIILIAVLISIYKLFRLFFFKKDAIKENSSEGFFKNVSSKPKDFFNQLKEEKNEKNFIQKKLEKITSDVGKDSKQIISDLIEIRKLIHEFGSSEKGKELISRKVESIIPRERMIHLKIKALRELVKKISNFDIQNFQNLQNDYNALPVNERKFLEKKLKTEWKKLDVEKQLLKLEEVLRKYDHSFNHHLELLIVSLRSNKIKSAVEQIDETIKIEKNLFKTIKQMEQLEKKLERFIGKEIKEISINQ